MPSVAKPMEYYSHHVLDFLLDDEDSAALTVYTEDNARMHIIADASKFEKSANATKGQTFDEFKRLIAAIRKSNDEEGSYSRDSGVEMDGSESATAEKEDSEDAEEALQKWMLEPVRRQGAKKQQQQQQPSLQEWYDAETQFFELDISKNNELCAVELEASSELKRRIAKLKPEITLPKYIRDVKVPWFDARKLTVLAGSASPPPYHPTQVRCGETGETLFFKAVDSYAPQSTKRELWHLNRIARADIVDKIRAPRLRGFVAYSTSKTRAIGFLQQDISDPTPLTNKLRAEVPQEKREAWASEAEEMKNALHSHDIVWGDAKADNFLVDKHDKLWIIDFGGSWTEGWIDPEIKETVQGDDMAMEKITNALHDPVANVEGAASEEAESPRGSKIHEPSQSQSAQGVKRKASEPASENSEDDQEDEESHQHRNGDTKKHKPAEEPVEEVAREESPPSEDEEPEVVPTPPKRRKSKQIENQAAERYCYCDSPSAGPMVGCDNPDCERQWFHFYCAGLKKSPPEDVAWFCRDCSA